MIDYKKELNEEQYAAVTHGSGPALILAGAGTGKTRCLVYRVSWLIEHGVAPERILLLTFTNKAADEMKNRIQSMIGKDASKVTASTYHSFCARQLRFYGKVIDIPNNYTIIEDSDEADLIAMVRADCNLDKIKNFPRNRSLLNLYSTSVNKDIPLNVLISMRRLDCFKDEILLIRENLQAYKKAHHMLDYDDILVEFKRLLSEKESVRRRLDVTYQHIMVDEYQDTNKLQDEILTLLRKDNRNLTVVGDDSQSLYAFRGADVENILRFPTTWKDCKTYRIMTNYRSCQEILDVANHSLDKNLTEGFNKTLKGTWEKNALPYLIRTEDKEEETAFVLDKIKELTRLGETPAVLVRNAAMSYELEIRLTSEGIPFVKYGGQKFLDKKHIKDVLAMLKVIVNPLDEISWFRILRLCEGIGSAYGRELSRFCITNQNLEFTEEEEKKHKRRRYYPYVKSLFALIRPLRGKNIDDCINKVIPFYIETVESDIATMKTTEDKKEEERLHFQDAKQDLEIFKDLALKYKSVAQFLEEITLDQVRKEENQTPVVISTIHSAKGLEWDTVFILDCIEGLFPKDELEEKEIQEELRCFYVAVTRAKRTLYIMAPEFVVLYGKVIYGVPTHFIREGFGLFQRQGFR